MYNVEMQEVARTDMHVLTSIAFAADGSLLALCAASGEVVRCDVHTGEVEVVCALERVPVGLAVDTASVTHAAEAAAAAAATTTAAGTALTTVWLTYHSEPCVARAVLPLPPRAHDDEDAADEQATTTATAPPRRTSSSSGGSGNHARNKAKAGHAMRAAAPASAPPRVCAVTPFVSSIDGRTLLGPTAVAVCPLTREVVFTDAGGEGDSSLAHPVGAVYRTLHTRGIGSSSSSSSVAAVARGDVVDAAEDAVVLPLCAHGVCQPSAVAVGRDGCVFVCEQAANRVLRFVRRGSYYVAGVFAHLRGSLGPSAVAVSPRDGTVYVAMYEPSELAAGDAYAQPHNAHDDDDDDEEEEEHQAAFAASDGAEAARAHGSNSSGNGSTTAAAAATAQQQRYAGAAPGVVHVFARDGSERGVLVTPASQLRGIAVDAAGAYVYAVHTDEATCTSVIYRCPTRR